ncbi:MAG: DNA-directed DNA polymerase, partial [Candidatus Aenigmatarchaeota archaeon]
KLLGKEGKEVKALKIFSYHPSDLPKIRDRVKKMDGVGKENCYGFSMSFYRRYLIDKDLKPANMVTVSGPETDSENFDTKIDVDNIEPKDEISQNVGTSLAFDLESYERGSERKIIMLSLVSDNFRRVLTYEEGDYPEEVEVLENEEELIERFIKIVRKEDPDLLVTYNGDDYDFDLLKERSKKYGLDLSLGRDGSKMKFKRRAHTTSARIFGRVHVDLYRFVDHILGRQLETEVLSLNEVAGEILGEEKIDMEFEEIIEKWKEKKELSKLSEYSLRDSELTIKLSEQFLPQINAISRIVGQIPFDTSRMTYGQLVEWFLLRNSYPERIPPNRPKHGEVKERHKKSPYKGGFVKEPIPGLHEDITVLDFKSLYPTIIVSYNISPETMNCDCCEDEEQIPGMDICFCQEEEGFIPSLLGGLIEERTEVKEELSEVDQGTVEYRNLDSRQYALKVLANSVYGYYGYVGARWYSRECARAITSLGRKWIKEVMKTAAEEGFKVIYGDTDSLMITDSGSQDFLGKINSKLPGIMRLELEGKFDRGLFVSKGGGEGAKKRYALANREGKLKIRGFETVRKDWCALAKRTQRKILQKVLVEGSKSDALQHAKSVIEDLEEKKTELKDLVIYTQLTKPIEEYESTGPHVEAAKKMEERGEEVEPGTTIIYVITEGDGSISDRAVPVEMADSENVDADYYIDRQIVPAAMRVLEVLGVDERQLKGEGKQESLEDFP